MSLFLLLALLAPARAADDDGDGFDDAGDDNCPGLPNPDQADVNGDGWGDLCVHPTAAVDPSATLEPGAIVGAAAVVGSGAILRAGAVVAPRAQIGAGAVVGGGAVIGRRAVVGDRADVGGLAAVSRASEVGADARLGAGALLGYAGVVGAQARVGGGVILGNLARVGPGAELADGSRVGRAADVEACAELGAGASVGPEAGVGIEATVGPGARVQRGADVGEWAVLGELARVGRSATVGVGARIGRLATVRSSAALGGCAAVADEAVVGVGALLQGGGASPCVIPLRPGRGDDLWTTSVYSYAPGGNTPGGGMNADILRIGGWGDTYLALLRFDLTEAPAVAGDARIWLWSYSGGGSGQTSFYADRIDRAWDWRNTGTGRDRERLWWADRPTVTQSSTAIGAAAPGTWQQVPITTWYAQWMSGAAVNHGVQLRPSSTSNRWTVFQASDLCDGSIQCSRPESMISPVDVCRTPRLVVTAP